MGFRATQHNTTRPHVYLDLFNKPVSNIVGTFSSLSGSETGILTSGLLVGSRE